MSFSPLPTRRAALASAAALLFMLFALAPQSAQAGPVVGLVESFTGAGNVGGWSGGANYSNPGTGGVGGAGDGYLQIDHSIAQRLGTHNESPDYAGDWLAAGADRVRFSLNDVGANQNLEIHFAIGNQSNFWQYNVAFLPPENAWSEFTVDLRDSANFTQTIAFSGQGFGMALVTCDRIQIRHDKAPYVQTPDAITGQVGVDEIKTESSLIGVDPVRPAGSRRPVMLAPPAPNPSRGGALFAFETFDDGPVTVAIVDARGRLLRRVSLAGGAPGRRSWSWDGLDDGGRSVPAGVYRVRAFTAAGGGTSRSFVRLD